MAKATVLLIDDQPIIGENVRRMVSLDGDVSYHYCKDPAKAMGQASEVNPTVVMIALTMREADGLRLISEFKSKPQYAELPLIALSTRDEPKLKAEAFAAGANDFLLKLPERPEMLARIHHHSKGYLRWFELNQAYEALAKSQAALAQDLDDAAKYVRTLLPPPTAGCPTVDWIFVTSTTLGGDAFDYFWLDKDHFLICLLDVGGHGVGAALLSMSAIHYLRNLQSTIDPATILAGMNKAFPMEAHQNMFISIWLGVYSPKEGTLNFASAGHPPAALIGRGEPQLLQTHNAAVGVFEDTVFSAQTVSVTGFERLYVFSDGVIEFYKSGSEGRFGAFIEMLQRKDTTLQSIKNYALESLRGEKFEDDFSILKMEFFEPEA